MLQLLRHQKTAEECRKRLTDVQSELDVANCENGCLNQVKFFSSL
jgi:hypothetical protein